jgi:hypothetical protein
MGRVEAAQCHKEVFLYCIEIKAKEAPLLPVFCVAFLSHAKIMKFCDFVTGMQEFY